jgi:peptide/nickel transport system substrate-binding protein
MSSVRVLLVVVMLALVANSSASAQGVLRIGLNDDPDALDPTISRAYVGRLVFAALCDKLFDVTPDLKIVPQLATGYEWAADHRSVVLKLRPGVKFHDGEPFNAEGGALQLERHTNTPGSFRKSEIGEITKVDGRQRPDVRLHLLRAAHAAASPALTDRAGHDGVARRRPRSSATSSGTKAGGRRPLSRSSSACAEGKIALERFANYWDKGSNVHLDRVEFVPITDSDRRASQPALRRSPDDPSAVSPDRTLAQIP